MTVQSALFAFYSQTLQRKDPPVPSITIIAAGFVLFVASVIIEQRTITLFSTMIKKGKELEFNLGLIAGQYSRLSELRMPAKGLRKFVTHTWGIRLIYGMTLVLWIFLLIYNYYLPQ